MAQLLRRGTSCFDPPRNYGYTDMGSISSQGKTMNVFYHEVNMVLWPLFSNI